MGYPSALPFQVFTDIQGFQYTSLYKGTSIFNPEDNHGSEDYHDNSVQAYHAGTVGGGRDGRHGRIQTRLQIHAYINKYCGEDKRFVNCNLLFIADQTIPSSR